MGLKRTHIQATDHDRWVYNRMVDAYASRPDYPAALITRLCELAGPAPARVVDLGAGLGHLSLPLAEAGHHVSAVEPARAMLDSLMARAAASGLSLTPIHAAAEALPLPAASADLVVIADALHFMDAHRTGRELARILAPGAALAFVQVELGDAPFMQALRHLMEAAAPRRPKRVAGSTTQVATLAGVRLLDTASFTNTLLLDAARLERILDSISFIGPAMNAQRRADFHARIRSIEAPPVWQTRISLDAGRS